MTRAIKIASWTISVAVVLLLVVIALVFTVANTDWGRRLAESTTARLSGGQVLLTGVSGRFPDDLHVDRIELRDGDTPWLDAQDITLRWSPARLMHKALQVEVLRARRVLVLR